MRNIVEYPVTLPEIAETLTHLAEEMIAKNAEDMVCGSMQPYLLTKAAEVIAELHQMIAHAPSHLPSRPPDADDWQKEDHGAALTEFAFAEMVRKVLTLSRHESN